MPVGREGRLWGFQLWINLPKKHKMTKPRYGCGFEQLFCCLCVARIAIDVIIVVQRALQPVLGCEGRLWGFQLWINLPKKHKMTKPRYVWVIVDELLSVLNTALPYLCGYGSSRESS
jgi:hypothetical protein